MTAITEIRASLLGKNSIDIGEPTIAAYSYLKLNLNLDCTFNNQQYSNEDMENERFVRHCKRLNQQFIKTGSVAKRRSVVSAKV